MEKILSTPFFCQLAESNCQCTEKEAFEEYDSVEVNLESLAYVSSAGLRVLHATHKRVKGKGKLVISHANGTVLDVFESTGFSSYLTII